MAKNVLLIDDDPEDCFIIQEQLLDEGWSNPILMAHDGIQGLKLLKNLATAGELPRLVVLDLNMPKMGGLETLANIKKDYPEIIVIMYSTACHEHDTQAAIKLGAHSCINKPSTYTDGSELARKMISLVSD